MTNYKSTTDDHDAYSFFYSLFLNKKWEDLKTFFQENELNLYYTYTVSKDSCLHLALYSGDKELVEALLDMVYKKNSFSSALEIQLPIYNAYGNTPLHEATTIGNVGMVQMCMKYDEGLLLCRNLKGETPFFLAAKYGKTNVVKYLKEKVVKMDYDNNPMDCNQNETENPMDYHVRSNNSSMLHEAIRGYYFDTALELVRPEYHIDTNWKDSDGKTCFQLLANIPSAFESGCSLGFLEKLIYHGLQVPEDPDERENNNADQVTPSLKTDSKLVHLRKMKKKHSIVVMLSKILAEKHKSLHDDSTTDGQSDTPLIVAARNGITEIVEAILKEVPQIIEQKNNKNENVFHVAVENRRKNILDLLESYNFKEPRLIWKFNAHGDGILHKAAYKSEYARRGRPGEALRLQSDIQWFQRVKKMVPSHHINHLNKKKLTPQALFKEEHKDLVKNGQEWLIRTTNSCIIVAVLIATVAFTSIYTVPGGSNPKTGKPLLRKTTAFTVFTASDVASLCFAFTSVVVFLSITTSKMNEQAFRRSLPLKLVLGLSMLFWSVAALMVGFAATLVITISHRHQAAAPIIAIACFPVGFFLYLQLPLYANITWYTMKDLLQNLIDFIPHRKYTCKPLRQHHVC